MLKNTLRLSFIKICRFSYLFKLQNNTRKGLQDRLFLNCLDKNISRFDRPQSLYVSESRLKAIKLQIKTLSTPWPLFKATGAHYQRNSS